VPGIRELAAREAKTAAKCFPNGAGTAASDSGCPPARHDSGGAREIRRAAWRRKHPDWDAARIEQAVAQEFARGRT